MNSKLILRKGAEGRILSGHPWIYRNEIDDVVGSWAPDGAIAIHTRDGRFIGRGFYNPKTAIACRSLTSNDEPIDLSFFRRRIESGLAYRRDLGLDTDTYRLVSSEGDQLPGLIADRYGDLVVVQCLTLGMEQNRHLILQALESLLSPRGIFFKTDRAAQKIEGLAGISGWLRGEGEREVQIREGGARFWVDLEGGHKTGFYLDQRESRQSVAALAKRKRLLDAFCYTGAFACLALLAGAREAVAIESSKEALNLAQRNAELNGVADRLHLIDGNAFDELRRLERAREQFDLVILDPPSFTRRRGAVEAALRGYKEINIRALRLLEPGGILATFSCSHHVSPALFDETLRASAGDAGRSVRLIATLTQARDHPILLNVPETFYLKGRLCQVV
ncbi:MAG TPA: class I SAM-dependent rRNA methyltransferase [Methylomirabilota bacterium]|nr:class I SAM-dependent rRNA methyltransferase [Methylomirabilota bacterium]